MKALKSQSALNKKQKGEFIDLSEGSLLWILKMKEKYQPETWERKILAQGKKMAEKWRRQANKELMNMNQNTLIPTNSMARSCGTSSKIPECI